MLTEYLPWGPSYALLGTEGLLHTIHTYAIRLPLLGGLLVIWTVKWAIKFTGHFINGMQSIVASLACFQSGEGGSFVTSEVAP